MGKKIDAVPTTPTAEPNAAILWLNPKTLTIHPVAEKLPMLPEDDGIFLTLVSDIRERGIDEPLKIDSKNRVMDGRHRRAAAIAAELEKVPCIVRDDADVAGLVIGSLVARRHYTKSGRAWVSLPLIDTLLDENRKRTLQNLKRGNSLENSPAPAKPPLPGKRVEDLVNQLGFGMKTYAAAREIEKLFNKRPEIRDEFEPLLLSGEMNFWNIGSAVAGRDATKGKTPGKRPASKLIAQTLAAGISHFSRWDKINGVEERGFVRDCLGDFLDAIPRDLRPFAVKRLREAQ